jgi:hypothetical protein
MFPDMSKCFPDMIVMPPDMIERFPDMTKIFPDMIKRLRIIERFTPDTIVHDTLPDPESKSSPPAVRGRTGENRPCP